MGILRDLRGVQADKTCNTVSVNGNPVSQQITKWPWKYQRALGALHFL